MRRTLPLSLVTLSLFLAPIFAPSPAFGADPAVDKAVKRGALYLKNKQDRKDGFFKDKWFHAYPAGETALSLLTLLKAGEDPSSPIIRNGFKAMFRAPLKKIYSVSIGILAVEARYSPTAVQLAGSADPYKTVARKKFRKKAAPADRKWLIRATQFLVKNQKKNGLWNYPFGGDDDVSNAQFALLALKSAKRLGIKVPDEVWARSMNYFINNQQTNGGKVEQFRVPAADGDIAPKGERRWMATNERVDMFARGWGYKPGQGPRGSMTAAGVACLVVIKSELEKKKSYQKRFAQRVDKAIRDGSAWLAQNFRADKHPGAEADWLYYYLYTLERAGTLTGCEQFGSHTWYQLGKDVILRSQKGDGSFEHSTSGEVDGKLAGSCFAILFLKRSTVPVLERVATGSVKKSGSSSASGPSTKKLANGQYEVTLRYQGRSGARVSVAGSFNGWNKDQHVLSDKGNGQFEITVTLNAGSHQYKFVVDGQQWLTDPKNSKKQKDSSGNENSILDLP